MPGKGKNPFCSRVSHTLRQAQEQLANTKLTPLYVCLGGAFSFVLVFLSIFIFVLRENKREHKVGWEGRRGEVGGRERI